MVHHSSKEAAVPGAALGKKLWETDMVPDMTVRHSKAIYTKDGMVDFHTYIDNANLFSDGYCEVSLRDLPLVSLIIAVALKRRIDIREVKTQVRHVNFYGKHDAVFDVEAKDREGNIYIIEVQRKNKGMSKERVLFYHSIAYVGSLEESVDYPDGPKRFVIVISKDDIFNIGMTMDTATFSWRKNGFWDGCGMEVIYMNAAYIDMGTEEGRLMHDFVCTDANKMVYSETKRLAQYYKNTNDGKEEMTYMFENAFPEHDRKVFAEGKLEGMTEGKAQGIVEGKAEGLAEGKAFANRSTALWLLKNGFPPAVATGATGLPMSDVLDIAASLGTV